MRNFLTGLIAMLVLAAGSLAGAPAASASLNGPPSGGFFSPSPGTTLYPGGSLHTQGYYMNCQDYSGSYQAWAISTELQVANSITGSLGAWTTSMSYTSTQTVPGSPWTVPPDAAGKYLIFRFVFRASEGGNCPSMTSGYWYMAFYVGTPSPPNVTARTLSTTAGTAITPFSMSVTNSPTSYSATGLPSGLSINPTSGQISGTPSSAGSFTSTITATNAGGSGSGTLTSSIAFATQSALTISTTSGTFGRDLALATAGGGGTGAVTYTLGGAGSAGCSLSGSVLHFTSIGTCVVTAAKTGDSAYSPASSSATTITVAKGTPTITWSAPSSIIYPAALTATQLNAVALLNGNPVAGTLNYSPVSGVILAPGIHTLTVSYTPTDTVNVNPVPSTTVSLSVSAGTALTPQFGSSVTELGGFRIPVLNYDPNFSWAVSATGGSASFDASAREIRVTGLSHGTSSSVTLTTTRTHYSSGSTTVSGTALAVPNITSGSTAIGEVGLNFTGYVVAGSGSPTSFTASGLPAPLTIDAATGAITGVPAAAGTFTVTVAATNAAGTGSRTISLTVNRGAQSAIGLTTTRGTFGTPLSLSVTGGTTVGPASYSVVDPGSAVCAISGSSLTSSQAGTCTVQVTRVGDSDYRDISASVQVEFWRIPQSSLAITSVREKGFGSVLLLAAAGGDGGGTITFAVTEEGDAGCSISGSTLTSTGDVGTSCGITATRAQSTNYLAQTSAQVQVTVTTKATQAPLGISSSSTATYGTPLTLSANGGSGTGAITYSVSTTGTAGCSIFAGELLTSGDVGTTCGVTAMRAEDTNFLAQQSPEVMVTVGLRKNQSISLTVANSREYSTQAFDVPVVADSALPVTLTSMTPSICSVSGYRALSLAVGTCTLVASQAGGANYLAANDVSRSVVITRAIPQIAWPRVPSLTVGQTLNTASLQATSSVNGQFVFAAPSGDPLPVGEYLLSATFTPADLLLYEPVTNSLPFSVVVHDTSLWWGVKTSLWGNGSEFSLEPAVASRSGTINYTITRGAPECSLVVGEGLLLRMRSSDVCEVRARIEATATHSAAESFKTFRRYPLEVTPNSGSGNSTVGTSQASGPSVQPSVQSHSSGARLGLPPAPSLVKVQRISTTRGKVLAYQPVSELFTEIDATVIDVRDSRGRKVSRFIVSSKNSRKAISVGIPFLQPNLKVTVYNINRAGVSKNAVLGANLSRASRIMSQSSTQANPRLKPVGKGISISTRGFHPTAVERAWLRKLVRSANADATPVMLTSARRSVSTIDKAMARRDSGELCRALLHAGLRTWLHCSTALVLDSSLPPGQTQLQIHRRESFLPH